MVENLFMIVAYVLSTRAIGYKNKSLWNILKADMRNFVRITKGSVVIVGRVTDETFTKQLFGRDIIIVTSDPHYWPKNYEVTDPLKIHIRPSLEAAYELAQEIANGRNIFIIGGEQIYTEALYGNKLPLPYEIYVTEVEAGDLEGDRVFPPPPEGKYREVAAVPFEKDDENEYHFIFRTLRHIAA
jgi:dihydrofolate reductase